MELDHTLCDNPFLHNSKLSLFFPTTLNLSEHSFDLKIDWKKPYPFFHAIKDLCIGSNNFLEFYFNFWEEAYKSYSIKDKENPVFWLTNACGVPTPKPQDWSQRRSGGYETISDAKTSVGMDRTDDIKKGIYQVLKLGAEYKPKYLDIKTALISNIHAVRHQSEYLQCIKNIIWTIDESREITRWSQINENTPLYNLFDGIISFTQSDIRDSSLKQLFKF